MNPSAKLIDIINSHLFKKSASLLFGNKKVEIIKRPASFIIKLVNEPDDKIFRIILLPPHGFTSNEIDRLSPHPEARKAKVEIKGGVKLDKNGFSLLKDVIKYQYNTVRNIKIVQDEPYPKIKGKNYQEKIKSAKEKFFVVKEDGYGFYHNLVNLSNEWLLLVLEKELRLQRLVLLDDKIKSFTKNEQKLLRLFYKQVLLSGDKIFVKDKQLVKKVYELGITKAIPALIEMLNILESGKHEACTIFAVILKIGKKNKRVIDYLKEALKKKTAPQYYLQELINKLS